MGPFEALRQAGVPIALGSDSNAVIDPFEEARSLEMASRLAGEARSLFAPAELLGAATGDSMAAIGWEPTELKAGAPADFVTIALDSVRTAGCDPELPATAVFAASSADVSQVVVAGNVVVDAGVHVRIDPGKEIAACIGELLG
jgi:cytosine/adenosine deaminase-related metal-dependent hydrolase